jgi:hypothetical protein
MLGRAIENESTGDDCGSARVSLRCEADKVRKSRTANKLGLVEPAGIEAYAAHFE